MKYRCPGELGNAARALTGYRLKGVIFFRTQAKRY
jgi:hypothetical protein